LFSVDLQAFTAVIAIWCS